MSNILIKIVNDDYTNDSSIANMINYIYRTKNCKSKQTEALPIHAYGILTVPPTYTSLINDFQAVYISANPENSSRHIWHVIFSYNRSKISKKFRNCIDVIAGSLGLVYPTCYAYHFDSNHIHCHMVISATPFLPAPEPLTGMNLANYITIKMNSSGFTFDINDEGSTLNLDTILTYTTPFFDDILNVDDVAKALKIGTSQAYKLVRSGKIQAFKEGRAWKIAKLALINYIMNQQ